MSEHLVRVKYPFIFADRGKLTIHPAITEWVQQQGATVDIVVKTIEAKELGGIWATNLCGEILSQEYLRFRDDEVAVMFKLEFGHICI